MANQYLVLRLIKIDRGIIHIGKPYQGKHIPYYAGLVVQNQTSFNLEYLDEYNSEILLRKFFGYEYSADPSPALRQIIQDNREFIEANLSTVIIPDLDEYLKMDKIRKAPRNADRMRMMAERMRASSPF